MHERAFRVSMAVFAAVLAVAAVRAQSPIVTAVAGTVRDTSGAGLADVRVELLAGDEVVSTTTTDSEGAFSVKAAPGRYTVRAVLSGFATASQALTVTVGMSSRIDLQLRRVGQSQQPGRRGDTPAGGFGGRRGERATPPVQPPATAPVPPVVTAPMPSPAPPPPPAVLPSSETHAVVPVFYATDRQPAPAVALTYGGARSATGALLLGRFDVSIPRDVHMVGTIERPGLWPWSGEDLNRHFVIRQRLQLSYEGFYASLREVVGKATRREAFVFVHGYNVPFEDAIYRTAQIAYDIGFDGAPILYSWPSEGRELGYPVDLNNAEWTVPHLRWFLEDVATRSGADVIHVIAHSMGNRPVVAALSMMAAGSGPAVRSKFSQIVLTAPDIDAATFPRLASAMRGVGHRITLYASSNDRALQASRRYQGYPRAGDTVPNVLVIDGVDTIDVSALETGFLGHSYYAENRSVISDLVHLIRNGLEPARRAGLRSRGQPPARHWVFMR